MNLIKTIKTSLKRFNPQKNLSILGCAMSFLGLSAPFFNSVAAHDNANPLEAVTLNHIRDAALKSDYAYQRLTELSDQIGPRLSGSRGAEAAVSLLQKQLVALGLKVQLQPVKVPHWIRGIEQAELVGYPNRPDGITQKIVLTALGGSSATPANGLTAPVIVVHSMEELQAQPNQIKGRMVLFDVPFDQHLADNGQAGDAYGQAGLYRFIGPATAAKLGAVAALVRSVGGADFRLPHTGMTGWCDAKGCVNPIPAAAVSAEDAMLMTRLAKQGEITLHLTLTPQNLPDADSYNVIADIVGRDNPEQIVIISGHVDSWDLGQGAIDDGAGVAVAMGVMDTLKQLGLKPRRTIRFVGWMNEENGTRGSKAYFKANQAQLQNHVATIETDMGAGRPLGVIASITPQSHAFFAPLTPILGSLDAPVFEVKAYAGGADVSPMTAAGVPSFEPLLDIRHYFHYHHTAADTLDKVEPENLRRQVAVLALLAWTLADMPQALPHLPAVKDEDD